MGQTQTASIKVECFLHATSPEEYAGSVGRLPVSLWGLDAMTEHTVTEPIRPEDLLLS